MKKRCFVFVSLIMVVLMLSVGCSNNSTKPEDKKEDTKKEDTKKDETTTGKKVEVEFWHGYSADKADTLKEFVKKFEEENKDIDIVEKFVASGEEILQKVQGAILSNELPDLLWGFPTWTGTLESTKKLVNVGEMMDEDYRKDIPEGVLNAGKYNDKIYSVPIEAGTLYMIYNKDMFKEAGIEKVPTTWDELYEAAKKLTNDKHKAIWLPIEPNERTTWTYETFLWQTGGDLLNGTFDKLAFTKEQGLKALNYYTKLITEGYAPTSVGQDPFMEKQVAIVYGTQGAAKSYINKYKMNVGVAMLPGETKQATGLGSNHYFLFDNDQAKKEAAFKFVKWMTTGENNAEWAIKTGYLPVSVSARDSEVYTKYGKENPYMIEAAKALAFGVARPPIEKYPKISSVISSTIEKIAYKQMTAEEGIDSIIKEINDIIK